jgi:hypothetical protein
MYMVQPADMQIYISHAASTREITLRGCMVTGKV